MSGGRASAMPKRSSRASLNCWGGAIAGDLQAAKAKLRRSPREFPGGIAIDVVEAAALIASGIRLRVYSFDKYKSKKPENNGLDTVTIMDAAGGEGEEGFRALCRDRRRRAPRARPRQRARQCALSGGIRRRARRSKVWRARSRFLNPAQMKKLGMSALLGVAQGSAHEPRLWSCAGTAARRRRRRVAFVGKGVTFDTGGISIKPAAGMEDMKGDMGGAACVTGLMLALATRKAR